MSKREIPIVCDPSALPDPAAHERASAELFAQTLRMARLDDGYQLALPLAALPLLATFIDGERRCCPFFTFTVTVPPAAETISLRLTGPAGTVALLDQELRPHLPANVTIYENGIDQDML